MMVCVLVISTFSVFPFFLLFLFRKETLYFKGHKLFIIFYLSFADTLKCGFAEIPEMCSGDFVTIAGLIKDEQEALQMQCKSGKDLSEVSEVCDYHYKTLVGQFKQGDPTCIDRCCDPDGVHFKIVQTSLRTVGVSTLLMARDKNITLIYGDKICKHCLDTVKQLQISTGDNVPEETTGELIDGLNSQETSSSGSALISQSVKKEDALHFLNNLGLSPIKLKSRTMEGKIYYGKRKLDAATEIIKKKICYALDLPQGSLESHEPQRSIDMDLLLEEIKSELPNASRSKKYQLLSLVPSSISVNQGCIMFGVSKTLFKNARDIRMKHGIIPSLNFSRQSSVLNSTKELIVKFYLDDENSKVLPGKNDCISVSKCVYEQKRLMLCSVSELYAFFKKKHEDLKVGLSIFYKLKPKWCVFPGTSGTHCVCVCQTHEDARLIIHAIGIKTYYRELIRHLVCNEESKTCMLRLCKDCLTISQIADSLRFMIINNLKEDSSSPEFELSDIEEEEFWKQRIEFYQWKTTDNQTELVTEISERSEVVEIAAKKMNELIPNEFISRNQAEYVKNLKSNLPTHKVVILKDFAMNHSCVFPKEIQSYHWSKKQVTIHPVVIFYKPDEESEVKHHSVCFISDDLTHDVTMVKVFQDKTMAILKEKFPEVTVAENVSDGCACQYKNKSTFWYLCHHEKEYGIKATHTYFATSHGKSLCDALSGSVKRLVSAASLQRTTENLINSAVKVYDFCKNHKIAEKIQFEFVSKVEVDTARAQKIEPDLLDAVPGTRSFHYYEPLTGESIKIAVNQKVVNVVI